MAEFEIVPGRILVGVNMGSEQEHFNDNDPSRAGQLMLEESYISWPVSAIERFLSDHKGATEAWKTRRLEAAWLAGNTEEIDKILKREKK